MSSQHSEESAATTYLRAALAGFLVIFIVTHLLDGDYWLFAKLIVWQMIHMYVLGRKEISFGNFDGADLITGCIALYFFFTAPWAYLLTAPLLFLVTLRSARRAE